LARLFYYARGRAENSIKLHKTQLASDRTHGVRRLLIYCSAGLCCHHSAIVDADRWPDVPSAG
jgi:hypothetical protein